MNTLLENGQHVDYAAVRAIAPPERSHVPVVNIGAPDLRTDDA